MENGLSKSYLLKTKIGVLSVSMMGMASLAITPSYAAIAKYFIAGNTLVQMLTSLPNLFMMIAGFVVGKLASMRIREKVLVLSAISMIIIGGILPLFYHESLLFLLVCSCLVGFGQGACTNLSQVLVTRMLPSDMQQSAMGQTTTFTNLGGMVFIMGGGLLGVTSWVRNYWIYIFAIFVLLLICALVPMSPLSVESGDAVNDVPENGQIHINKYVWYISFWAFFTMLMNNVLNNNIALFITRNHFGGTSQAAITTTISLLGGLLCGLIVGMLGKKFKYSTIAMSFFGYAISYLVIGCARNLIVILIGSFVVGAAMSIAMGQYPYLMSLVTDKNSVSMGLGIWAAVYSIGGVLSPFVINPLVAWLGNNGIINVFSISGTLALVIGIIVLITGFQRKLVNRTTLDEK
ncbi:MFS transporter [Ligilactobacillus sp. LYQ60]|uniref:MFS transporter n=1 Tax=unclassified Ligilactobacillus TaxID=2767920 RepID=UPI00385245C4